MNTLIIQYLPSGETSRTRRLRQAFLKHVTGTVVTLDLLQNPPNFMTSDVKAILFKRSYLGESLNADERAVIGKNDHFLSLLRAADRVVFAYPMHNYSMPAIVKAFFDAVIIKGETFDLEGFNYRGLLGGKRALALITSGGVYEEGSDAAELDHCFKLQNILCRFVGFDQSEVISVQGTDMFPPEELEPRFDQAEQAIRDLCAAWYSEDRALV
ncbi:FMN-dependent NADH-azoreductase [Acanthopleuribacter pedis]|uniref:FMN dependent NADH:quinone oxidoreductase n=1 Tax=Acanthopleuribacter pedis TaxID=442870 RepID=A0A8J7Q8P5_9BACT|nr:NAD(P)H-dependent oxidoreductase [Acanthopleuribacter pedis]MBO1320581.1 NAD(P)H-dependent oxidoreductase [Acanthopleuribacter pedis]